nr:acetyl-CoA hydrolase/transferase C-terminal domain-containing protein [Halegenticoccus tardaugens]
MRVVTAAAAADSIAEDAAVAVSGFGSVGYPKAVPQALAASGRDLSLTIISGGSVGDEIDTELVEAGAIARRYPFQTRAASRAAINEDSIAFHDRHIAGLGDDVAFGTLPTPDVAVVEAVSVGEDWFVPSTSIGQTPSFVRNADRLVVEVNDAQPLDLRRLHDVYLPAMPPHREPIPLRRADERIGTPRIPFDADALTAVVRTDTRDATYTFREPTPEVRDLAANLGAFLSDEVRRNPVCEDVVHLQFGVGSIGNALMGELESIDVGGRDLVYYGEVIQDGLLNMLDAGLLSSASATSLALTVEGQDRLFADLNAYADQVVVRPANVSNAPSIIRRLGVLAVNSAVEVDLYGHVNATHVRGTNVVNGIGGSSDFSRHAAVSVIALPSTAAGGDVSRIVPMATHVDLTEHDVSVVVTEQGVADLRGLAPRERAAELITECAHPSFREDLRAYVERAERTGGHIPHDLETAFDWRSAE